MNDELSELRGVNEADLLQAERKAAIFRRYKELRAGGQSQKNAVTQLNAPVAWFSGENCLLAQFNRDGLAALLPAPRDTSDMGRLAVPDWFIPVAKYFYLLSNHRRAGGSVPEAVLRTIEMPNVPFGWIKGQADRLLKITKLSELPVCPPDLRETILVRFRERKDLVPRTIARQIAAPSAIIQQYRSPRAAALDNFCAPGSQRRYFNAESGQRQIMQPGDWYGGDDATPGIAVCIPSNEIRTPSSQKYGVLLGRFQWLAFHDCRTDKILGFEYVIRPRGSYRAEDILSGMQTVVRANGLPRRGWQFEGGSWQSKLIRHAAQQLGCELWRTYSPHQKAIESVFNRVWTRLAVQFPHADLGRFRNENEANCRLYEDCKAGHKDARRFFPPLETVTKAFEEETAWHNSKPILSRQYGQWVPSEMFDADLKNSPLRPCSPEMQWIFNPYVAERKIQGMLVRVRVPMFEKFSVPFEFSAPWMPLHRGKLVRVHFNPRDPECVAKIVLLENSGTSKPGDVLGDAPLIGETAQHIRFVLNWAKDDQRAGYRARQQAAHLLRRESRGIGAGGRIEYSASERRDGLRTITKLERDGRPVQDEVPPRFEPAAPAPLPALDPESFKARRSKISRLPREIQYQLNERLASNQPSPKILPWLNTLPAVVEILAGGKPISAANLSEWRLKGGFSAWLGRREQEKPIVSTRAEREKRLAELNAEHERCLALHIY